MDSEVRYAIGEGERRGGEGGGGLKNEVNECDDVEWMVTLIIQLDLFRTRHARSNPQERSFVEDKHNACPPSS